MATAWQFLRHPLQLIASFWDTAPPITVPTALPAGSSALPPITAAAQHLNGLCGWLPVDGDTSRTFVCQALGQTMPAVVFLVSSALFIGTVLFLVRYLTRARVAVRAMEALEHELHGHLSPKSLEWPSRQSSDRVIAAVNGGSRRLPPLTDLGKQLEFALCSMAVDGDAVALGRPASELPGGRRYLDGWTGKRLADELPGWLSAIGLLTTFIAILLGLQSVKVSAGLEVNGIAGLVNGLSGKFFSSIVALGCAVTVSIVNHFVGVRLHEGWSAVLERIERILPHLSAERMLLELLRQRNA